MPFPPAKNFSFWKLAGGPVVGLGASTTTTKNMYSINMWQICYYF